MVSSVPLTAARALHDVETLGDRVQLAVARRVERKPTNRGTLLSAALWAPNGDGVVAAARAAGAALVDAIVGAPGPPPVSIEEYHEAALLARVAALRAAGDRAVKVDGRWLRESAESGRLTWVPTLRSLAHDRLYRAELAAWHSGERLGRRLGLDRKGRVIDPRVKAHRARMTGLAAGRIAHDVAVDAFRDSVFEQFEQRPEVLGWRRLAERTACGACLGLADGRIQTTRAFYRHTRCRCIPIPVTATSPAIPTGRELFDALSEQEQDDLFRRRGGRLKAQALRDGRIDLSDLVLVADERLDNTVYVIGETPMSALQLG